MKPKFLEKIQVEQIEKILFILSAVVFLWLSGADSTFAGVNYLAGLKEDVHSTFGSGSDTQYFLLLAEGLAGAYAFWKTKSLPVLCGLPVLMVFTHWALK